MGTRKLKLLLVRTGEREAVLLMEEIISPCSRHEFLIDEATRDALADVGGATVKRHRLSAFDIGHRCRGVFLR